MNADMCPVDSLTMYELYCYMTGKLPVPNPFNHKEYVATPLLGKEDPSKPLDYDLMSKLLDAWWAFEDISCPK